LSYKDLRFLVDASSWIDCHERWYPPKVFPTLWRKIVEAAAEGLILAPRQVVGELGADPRGGGVRAWVEMLRPSIIVRETGAIVKHSNAVNTAFPALIHATEDEGDPWLVAHALKIGASAHVVTEERRSQPNAKKPHIPNVCEHFKVKCITSLQMFVMLGISI